MPKNTNQKTRSENKLLALLPEPDLKRFLAKSVSTELRFGDVIFDTDDIISDVYFPLSGIISLISGAGQSSRLEIGMVGREGMLGVPVFLGVKRDGNQAVVQGAGSALKMKSADFAAQCLKIERMTKIMRRYTHAFMTQISRTAVCNRFHPVGARLARWLLMTHDRMEADEFRLTQLFLSGMLGVRREAVTIAALGIQKRGLVTYSRGKMKILDRSGLESAACECYAVLKNEESQIRA